MKRKDIVNFNYFTNETALQMMREMEDHPIFYKGVRISYIENKSKIHIYMENVIDERINADDYDVMGPLTNAIAIVDKVFPTGNVYEECNSVEEKEKKLESEKSDVSENCNKRHDDLRRIYRSLLSKKRGLVFLLIIEALILITGAAFTEDLSILIYFSPLLFFILSLIFFVDDLIEMDEKIAEIDKDVEKINNTRKIK